MRKKEMISKKKVVEVQFLDFCFSQILFQLVLQWKFRLL